MKEPVFVIHGVANRNRVAFETFVVSLGRDFGGMDLRPVYWGDLGAKDEYLERVIPQPATTRSTRAGADSEGQLPLTTEQAIGMSLFTDPDRAQALEMASVRGKGPASLNGPRLIAQAAGERDHRGTTALRDGEPDLQTLLEEMWPELDYLPQVDDPALLRLIGVALAEDNVYGRDEEQTRGALDWLKQRVGELDRAVGAVIGSIGSRINAYTRNELAPAVARFAGDIAVYQRNPEGIQARVREALHAYDMEAGLADLPPADRIGGSGHPARFMCHSLGGVIALDLATTQAEPVYLQGLVTFGSQWPLFQLCDPRAGVTPYVGQPVALPPTVRKWVNLWEPMDPLAFIASNIFRLCDGSQPDDRSVPHLASSGLWTHSAYWHLPELAKAAHDVF